MATGSAFQIGITTLGFALGVPLVVAAGLVDASGDEGTCVVAFRGPAGWICSTVSPDKLFQCVEPRTARVRSGDVAVAQ